MSPSKQPKIASANWLALQKEITKQSRAQSGPRIRSKIATDQRKAENDLHVKKRRRLAKEGDATVAARTEDFPRGEREPVASSEALGSRTEAGTSDIKGGESIALLRRMVQGELDGAYTESQQAPGKYLALDCEMVGVGIEGEESSLARVSIVNFYGAVQMDEFVRQRERVVDYRTQWSGIRPSDMDHAKPFTEVQERVSELLKDRILVGHAVHNDLKALLLSHPGPLTRDTQHLAYKHKVVKGKRPALRNLVRQELDLTIQAGEHSSVTDSRATMAVFRIHRTEWEKAQRPMPASAKKLRDRDGPPRAGETESEDSSRKGFKRKHGNTGDSEGRRGVSSGLSVVVTRKNRAIPSKELKGVGSARNRESRTGSKWWAEI